METTEKKTAKTAAAAETKAESEDMVSIYVPKGPKDPETIWVAVNMVPMVIERGKLVKIPRPYAEAIANSLQVESVK